MFRALKRFFSKPAAPAPFPISTVPPIPAPAPAPPREEAAFAPPAPMAVVADPEEMIQLPLAPILASLSPGLAALVVSKGHGTFSFPARTALTQLASGAVRIPFGELRQGAPPGTFTDNPGQDRTPVSLPLPQILASINPALLARRPGQKVVVVPDNITSVFGQGRTMQAPVSAPSTVEPAPVLTPAPAPVVPVISAPVPAPAPAPVIPVIPIPVLAVTPAPVLAAAPAPVVPAAPKPWTPQPSVPQFARTPASAPLPSWKPKIPVPLPASLSFPAPKPLVMPTPVPSPAETEVLAVNLSSLTESWPLPVRQEIEGLQSPGATISLPMNRLEAGLKTGRVNFTWGELSQWLHPPPPENTSAHRDTTLELPLKIIAPIFLAQRRPASAQKKVTGAAIIPDNVPNLFARISAVPDAVVPAPAAPAAPANPLGEMFGLPGKIEWSPQEICQRIGALEGVAGSTLAMSDGLLVAGQMPPELSADTISAFLPQIFGRVNQSATAMQLEAVTGVVLMAGQARLAIFKTGKLYLAVLGRPGATLPEAMLGRIAAETAKRNS